MWALEMTLDLDSPHESVKSILMIIEVLINIINVHYRQPTCRDYRVSCLSFRSDLERRRSAAR